VAQTLFFNVCDGGTARASAIPHFTLFTLAKPSILTLSLLLTRLALEKVGCDFMPTKLCFSKGDITDLFVDAIVNPASTDLVLGEGVSGAILRKGGKTIERECELLGRIALGETAVTTAGNLKAFYIIHAAVIRPGEKATAESIRLATHNTLLRAEEKAYKTIAFPALGTGVAGFPLDECAGIMLTEVSEHLRSRSSLETIHFVLFDDQALEVFEATHAEMNARATT
jgi:O-acetyl-ADP-ribose deacetylase